MASKEYQDSTKVLLDAKKEIRNRLERYRSKNWDEDSPIPMVTRYLTKDEIYNLAEEYINSLIGKNYVLPLDRNGEIDTLRLEKDHLTKPYETMSVYTENDILDFQRISDGWLVNSESGKYDDVICPDMNCIMKIFDNQDIDIIVLYFENPFNNSKEILIYDSRFPFDFFLGDKEVSEEEYFKHLDAMQENLQRELSRFVIPDISRISSGYLPDRKKEKESKLHWIQKV